MKMIFFFLVKNILKIDSRREQRKLNMILLSECGKFTILEVEFDHRCEKITQGFNHSMSVVMVESAC